jgi:amidase
MRPTHGRIPLAGACPLAASFDTVGWFAREAAVLERVGRVLLGDSGPAPRPAKALIADDAFGIAGEDATGALLPAVDAVQAVLGKVEPIAVSDDGLPNWFEVFRVLQGAEIWAQHRAWVESVKPQFGAGVRERFEWTATIKSQDVVAAKAQREVIAQHMDGLLAGDAVLVLPTVPGIAPLKNSPSAALDDFRGRAMSLLCIAGLARLPQISLPMAALDDCPLGLSLIAGRGNDLLLLALAGRIVEAAA